MSSISRAFATVGSLTLVSRLLGFARETITAAVLGATPAADAFFVALRLPNFFRQIFAEGALSVSFVPMFTKFNSEDNGHAHAKLFAEQTLSWLIAILVPFTILAIIFMPHVIQTVLPGDTYAPGTARYAMAVEMTRVTFPYLIMISAVALMGGVLNSLGVFIPFAAAPIAFNVVMTMFLGFIYINPDLFKSAGHAMSWGLIASGIVQFFWLYWACRRAGFNLMLRLPTISPEIKRLFIIMLPGIFAGSVTQINLLVDQTIASFLPNSAVSYLYYAERLNQLPIGILGVAAGTALLPMLSMAVKDHDTEKSRYYLSRCLEFCLWLGLPCAVVLIIAAEPIQMVLFQRGAFTVEDAHASALALMAVAVGVPAYVLAKSFATVFFAHHDTKTPVKVGVVVTIANSIIGYLLSQHWASRGYGHVGIALATGVTGWLQVVLLGYFLHKQDKLWLDDKFKTNWKKIVICGAGMAAVLGVAYYFLAPIFDANHEGGRALALLAMLSAGGATYLSLSFLLKTLTVSDIKTFMKRPPKPAAELQAETLHE